MPIQPLPQKRSQRRRMLLYILLMSAVIGLALAVVLYLQINDQASQELINFLASQATRFGTTPP